MLRAMVLLGPLLVVACKAGGRATAQREAPPAASQVTREPSADVAPMQNPACGGSCISPDTCFDGKCCSLLHTCIDGCCADDAMCNVYQCYRPIFCGPKLPKCPALTLCDDYVAGTAECSHMSADAHERNAEYCARMAKGKKWLSAHARGSAATGTCLPEMAPHRLGQVRWYRSLAKHQLVTKPVLH